MNEIVPKKEERLVSFTAGRSDLPRRGYSFFVKFMKWVMPLAALAIVGVLIFHLQESETPAPLPVISATPKITPQGQIALTQARYEGVDHEKRPFRITADEASGTPDREGAVSLKKPMADITFPDGSWLSAQADQGRYVSSTAFLSLSGHVRIFHDLGYELLLQVLDVSFNEGTAKSGQPVKAQGPVGRLEAQSLEVSQNGARVLFRGPLKLTLFMKERKMP